MNCQEFQKYIQMYLDGVLASELVVDFQAHLDSCPACAKEFEQALLLDGLLKETLSDIKVPEDFAASVMAKLSDNNQQSTDKIVDISTAKSDKGKKKTWALVACAAAVAVCFGVAGLANDDGQNTLPNQMKMAEQKTPADYQQLPTADVETPGNIKQNVVEQENNNKDSSQDIKVAESSVSTNDVVENKENKENKTVESDIVESPDVNSSGVVERPKVAYNTQVEGEFNITVLAQHENASALAPHIKSNGNIEYLLETSDGYQLWQQSLTASEAPVLLEEDAWAVTRGENNASVMSWLDNRDYIIDISDDNTFLAANIKGADGGLWVSPNDPNSEPKTISPKGGGSCLAIAPDGSKIAFTDEKGKLYVAYLAEEIVLEIFTGDVSYVEWLGESRTLVFAGIPEGSSYSNIYRATTP